MKQYLMQRLLLSVLCLTSVLQVSYAQQPTKPEDFIGKITGRSADGKSWHFEMLNNLDRNKKAFPQMKNNLMQVFSIAIQAPVVNPLKGFDAAPDLVAYQLNGLLPAAKMVSGEISFMCFNFTKNRNGKPGFHEEEESHGGLNVYANDLSQCYNDDFKNVCDDYDVPVFFFRPEMKKVSQGVFRIGKDVLVLKKAVMPLFIPLSKKEYLTFLLKRMIPVLKSGSSRLKSIIADTMKYHKMMQAKKQELEDIKSGRLKIANKTQRKVEIETDAAIVKSYPAMINISKKGMVTLKKQLTELKKLIQQYQKEISDGSSSGLQAGVYINENDPKELPVEDDNLYYEPVASNTPDCKALYQINPDYYDRTLPKTTPQVIVLSWHASHFCPQFERQALEKWFNQINYQKLQAMIK